jgi:hypothetical protein
MMVKRIMETAKRILTKASRDLTQFVNMRGIATWSVAFFVAIIHHQIQNHVAPHSDQELSKVSGLFGRGSYYGWLLNEIVAVYESIGHEEQDMIMLFNTLIVAILPSIAAISQLQCVARPRSCVQPQNDAYDRVIMMGWILNMHYHLQRMAKNKKHRLERPLLQTFVRIVLEILYTVAMVSYDIQRGTLGRRLLLCLGPFLVCIVFPLIILYYRYFRQWQWARAVINTGTIVISVAYVFTLYEYRYDPHSPTAPLTASTLADMDQVAALVASCLVLLLHVLGHFEKGKVWRERAWTQLQAVCRRRVRPAHGPPLQRRDFPTTDTEYHGAGEEQLIPLIAELGFNDTV